MTDGQGQVVPLKQRLTSVSHLLDQYKPRIRQSLPKHVDVDRWVRAVSSAIQRQPEILDCTQQSLMLAILQASELGLRPGLLQEAYLVPFRNSKTGKREVQLIPGYRGLIRLARNSGQLISIEARAVYERDQFRYQFGLEPRCEHIPFPGEDRGKLTHVYGVARLRDGAYQFDVMTKAEVDGIRNRSRAKDGGPWVTDYESMGLKTVLRRLCKLLPASDEMTALMEREEMAEAGIADVDIIDLPAETDTAAEPTQAPQGHLDRIVAERKRGRPPKIAPPPPMPENSDYAEGDDGDPNLDREPGMEG